LSRVYRKFGVRSRTALAHAMTVAVLAAGAAAVDSGADDQVKPPTQAVMTSQPDPGRTSRTRQRR
ncbi:hypothetical protein SAMN04487983_10521, partial [Streptomyces sp. yr375]|uniref:hypothetical protein n=1 Tax=Streptomyces sp. yr375 TaxID=1761906 RepID=UPI0008BE1BF5